MTAITLPNSGLKAGFVIAETGWSDEMNRNLRTLDALINLQVKDKDLATPPGSPVSGDVYIVGAAATGAWATHEGHLAVWAIGDDIVAGEWSFVVPKVTWEAYVVDETATYRHSGSAWVKVVPVVNVPLACSDETTAITTGKKVTFHAWAAMKLDSVFAALTTVQTAGSLITVDVRKNGSSILTTKITLDNSEPTSLTAATPAVISTHTFAKGDEISIFVDQVGTAGATGLKLYPQWVLL